MINFDIFSPFGFIVSIQLYPPIKYRSDDNSEFKEEQVEHFKILMKNQKIIEN